MKKICALAALIVLAASSAMPGELSEFEAGVLLGASYAARMAGSEPVTILIQVKQDLAKVSQEDAKQQWVAQKIAAEGELDTTKMQIELTQVRRQHEELMRQRDQLMQQLVQARAQLRQATQMPPMPPGVAYHPSTK